MAVAACRPNFNRHLNDCLNENYKHFVRTAVAGTYNDATFDNRTTRTTLYAGRIRTVVFSLSPQKWRIRIDVYGARNILTGTAIAVLRVPFYVLMSDSNATREKNYGTSHQPSRSSLWHFLLLPPYGTYRICATTITSRPQRPYTDFDHNGQTVRALLQCWTVLLRSIRRSGSRSRCPLSARRHRISCFLFFQPVGMKRSRPSPVSDRGPVVVTSNFTRPIRRPGRQ